MARSVKKLYLINDDDWETIKEFISDYYEDNFEMNNDDDFIFYPNKEEKDKKFSGLHVWVIRRRNNVVYLEFPLWKTAEYGDLDDEDKESLILKDKKYPQLQGKIIRHRTLIKIKEIFDEALHDDY